MAADAVTFTTWPVVRQRLVALEHELYTWGDIISQHKGEMEPAKERHAQYALNTAQAELTELRTLLAFWEDHQARNGKHEISLQVAIIAVSIYLATVLSVLVYLVVLAGR